MGGRGVSGLRMRRGVESGGVRGAGGEEGTWEEPPRTRSSLAVQSEAVQGLWGGRVSGADSVERGEGGPYLLPPNRKC